MEECILTSPTLGSIFLFRLVRFCRLHRLLLHERLHLAHPLLRIQIVLVLLLHPSLGFLTGLGFLVVHL
jgi:hypothetical protein